MTKFNNFITILFMGRILRKWYKLSKKIKIGIKKQILYR